MNMSVSTEALVSALSKLVKIVPSKAALPILSHVLIRAEDSAAWLSCTDTELALTRTVNAVVNEPGTLALPAKTLLDIANQISEPDVHLFSEKRSARIAAGQFKLQLQAMRVEDFPILPITESKGVYLPGDELRKLIRRVRSCITDTARRYCVEGAQLEFKDNVLMMVTTDGKRLALAITPYDGVRQGGIILPTKLLDTLVDDDADGYNFSTSVNQLFFASEQASLSSNHVDAKFPSYERTIKNATTNTNFVAVSRDLLSAALKRVSLVSGDSKIVRLDVANDKLQLQAKNAIVGEAQEHVAVQLNGSATHVHLQSDALLNFLDRAQNPTVTLQLGDEKAPALLKDGDDFLTIAMAVRV
jgi:DNA polymerase III subunit beta